MLLKPLKNKGRGSPKAVLKYLLGKPDGQARVLKGDPVLSQAIADSLSYQQSYDVWVLSFEEESLPEEVKLDIIAEFEKSFFPYFQDEPERYNTTWIEHSDKGRVELNLFMPKVDLKTEKQLSLFNKSSSDDWDLTNSFRNYINAKYGLTNPMDPAKSKLVKGADWIYKAQSKQGKTIAEYIELIKKYSENAVLSGEVSNRDELIDYLKSSGVEIARVRKDSISIKNTEISKTNIKIKGEFFSDEFRGIGQTVEKARARAEISGVRGKDDFRTYQDICAELRGKLERATQKRYEAQRGTFSDSTKTGRAFKGFNKYVERGSEIIESSHQRFNADREPTREYISDKSADERFRAEFDVSNEPINLDEERWLSGLGRGVISDFYFDDYTDLSDQQIQRFSDENLSIRVEQSEETKSANEVSRTANSGRNTPSSEYQERSRELINAESELENTRTEFVSQATGATTGNETNDNSLDSRQGVLLSDSERLSDGIALHTSMGRFDSGSRAEFERGAITEHKQRESSLRGALDEYLRNDTAKTREHRADTKTGFDLLHERSERYRATRGTPKASGILSYEDSAQIRQSTIGNAERTVRSGIFKQFSELSRTFTRISNHCKEWIDELRTLTERVTEQIRRIDKQNEIRERERQEQARKALEQQSTPVNPIMPRPFRRR